MFENVVLSYQNKDFPPASQISTILSETQAKGSPESLLAGSFSLI